MPGRFNRFATAIAISVSISIAAVVRAGDEASLVPIGVGLNITAISADGTAVCGTQGNESFRWTRDGGLEILPRVSNYPGVNSRAYSISWDGRVICGTTSGTAPRVAWRWREGVGTEPLPELPGGTENAIAENISANGQAILYQSTDDVGLRTVLWTETGSTIMPYETGAGEQPVALNFEGSRILTVSASGAVRVRNGSFELLSTIIAPQFFWPNDLSASGQTVVGRLSNRATLWTEGRGFWQVPGSTPLSTALAISSDGRYVLGQNFAAGAINGPWIWDAQGGLRMLEAIMLEELGSLPVRVPAIGGLSANGRSVLLRGSDDVYYVFSKAAPCAGDVDNGQGEGGRDAGVTADDIVAFLYWLYAGDLRADLDDGSGTGRPDMAVTIDDFLYFLNGFEAGC